MKKNSISENKSCFILYTISSILFLISAVLEFLYDGLTWMDIIDFGLSITFGVIASIYFKKYKKEK